ncbi:MAG: NAD-dependent epimerase/dehydratase family protein [Lentisphaerae bacterium]|nr:NAD-dependent epimerase/dehydratase family protein [Lentisphaerota bacterium]MCP4100089.1 NAD-dependent epimerase/dehydratase family protein [Lentisphaerota bacterium]
MANILVTGGAGYLGSVMVPELLKAGHKVTVLDNFMYQQNSLCDCCANENFQVVRGDCRDRELLKELTADKDYIFPLAALVGAPLCDRDIIASETINRDAIKTLTEVISDEQRIIIPITNSGYGVGEKGKFCTEETPLRPISLYGRVKVEAEKVALSRQNSVSLRLATVFGTSPRMRIDLLVNDFVHRAIVDRTVVIFEGHFKRNYVHIRDVARAFMHVMDNFEDMKGEAYNVGLSEANLSKLELCAKIKEHLPRFMYLEAPLGEDPDKRDYIVSNDKIESTGFKTAHDLDMGIEELKKAFTILNNSKYSNV